jgi:hypothetical protein
MNSRNKVTNERAYEYDISIAIPFFAAPEKMSRSSMLWSADS